MNIFETIKHRRSVRTFDGTALRPEDAQKILAFAEKLENPYDLPVTWKLLDAKRHGLSSPVIVGTDAYIAGKMRRAPHAEEAFPVRISSLFRVPSKNIGKAVEKQTGVTPA